TGRTSAVGIESKPQRSLAQEFKKGIVLVLPEAADEPFLLKEVQDPGGINSVSNCSIALRLGCRAILYRQAKQVRNTPFYHKRGCTLTAWTRADLLIDSFFLRFGYK